MGALLFRVDRILEVNKLFSEILLVFTIRPPRADRLNGPGARRSERGRGGHGNDFNLMVFAQILWSFVWECQHSCRKAPRAVPWWRAGGAGCRLAVMTPDWILSFRFATLNARSYSPLDAVKLSTKVNRAVWRSSPGADTLALRPATCENLSDDPY